MKLFWIRQKKKDGLILNLLASNQQGEVSLQKNVSVITLLDQKLLTDTEQYQKKFNSKCFKEIRRHLLQPFLWHTPNLVVHVPDVPKSKTRAILDENTTKYNKGLIYNRSN